MATVSPSILSANFAHLEQDCREAISGGAEMLHYDVMDGHFVPNISFGIPVLKSISRAIPEAFFDVHLMISQPQNYVREFAKAGANLINFHLESDCQPDEVIASIRGEGCHVGMTIKPATSPEALVPYLDRLDLVLVMSVEPGFGGQKFMPSALGKVRWLADYRKKNGCRYKIELDGGINGETGALSIAAGADILVAGSTVFGASDIASAVRSLRAL